MKINKFIIPILFTLCFFAFSMKSKALNVSGLGDGNVSPGSSTYCNDEQGCVHNEKGVRVTIVDKDGKRVSGTKTVDYWGTIPSGSPNALPGSTYKSAYINSYGNISFNLSGSYNIKTSTNTSAIGGISWSNQHELIENILKQIKFDRENPESCVNPPIFEEAGYDICALAVQPDCEDILLETYILIEPLFHINMKKHDLIVTGTEFTFLVHKQRQIDSNRVYNLSGDAGYGSAFAGMYITKLNSDDDIDYAFNAHGKKYVRLTETTARRYSEYADWAHTAAYGAGTEYYPLGNSMHLVWLGDEAEEICAPREKCCIPCSVDPSNPDCDPDDCCYDEKLPVSTDGTTEACKPWDDYWNGRGDWEEVCNPKCDPNTDPNGCCDDPEYLREHPGYYEAYCMPKNKTCPIPSLNPEYIAPYCDEINGIDLDFVPLNTAYFRDPVFNSNGGQFSDYNKVELIEKFKGHLKLPLEWLERVVKEYDENTFLAVAYREDSRYTTKINDYCSMHCQELFEVTLPENYPYVNAGRYFKWTLYGSKSTIANAADVKLCAIDIDLDKAIDDYQDYSANTVGPATALANVTCHEKYGVQPVIDGEFDSCDAYADEIVSTPGCASDYVCLAYAEQGECCDSCPDYDAGGHQIGSHPCNCKPLYVCTMELHDAAARNWYARESGTHYNPGCGSPGATPHVAMIEECNKKVSEYKEHVEGYSSYVEGIYNSIAKCNSLTDDDIEINMGVQLNYYTFFNDYHYSTLNDEIDAIDSGGSFADNYLCANNGDTDECNKDEHKFALGDRSHDGQNPNAISCDNTTRWTEVEKYVDYKKVCGPGSVSAVNPNDELKLDYDSNGVKMLNINGFSRCGGFRDGVAGPEFDYTLAESWNTIYMAYVSASKLYELNEEINACTCKDGEIMDSVDGTCTCEREVSYSDFINSGYNNYQQLPDGTLKVEFMNPTGLYPINLIYWTIGSVDENGRGHFDSMLSDPNVDGTGHDLCDQNECPDGEDCCRYDDPRGICRIKIKNRIIATPDNTGDCEEPPCYPEPDDNGRCDNKPCPDPDPDDVGDCVDDNGNPTGKCEKSTDLNLIYRVIDLDNPFPGTDGRGRTPGVNWMGKEDVITNNRNMEGSAIYNKDVEPLYSMTLTPALIKEIRAGNHKTDSLLGYTSSMMYPEGPTEPGGGYSLFLHRYLETSDSIKIKYDDREQFSNIQKTGDGVK